MDAAQLFAGNFLTVRLGDYPQSAKAAPDELLLKMA
jgi:hypothetical protein